MSVSRPFAFRVVNSARDETGSPARRCAVPHALGEVHHPGVDLPARHPREQACERGTAERADRPDARLRDPLVEDVVVDVPDEDAVALRIRRGPLDRRLAAEQRRHLGVLDDLAVAGRARRSSASTSAGFDDEARKLGRCGRGSAASPLVAVGVRVRARLALRGERVRGRWRPGVQVVLARMAVQVDQAGEKEILRAGRDDARIADRRRPPAAAALARRRRSARCARGRGRAGSRCARRPS